MPRYCGSGKDRSIYTPRSTASPNSWTATRRGEASAVTDLKADYVIVGAGSAGCVLADRLSEDGARGVLLEAGPSDWHPMIHTPAGALQLRANPPANWNYYPETPERVANRPTPCARSRVLG